MMPDPPEMRLDHIALEMLVQEVADRSWSRSAASRRAALRPDRRSGAGSRAAPCRSRGFSEVGSGGVRSSNGRMSLHCRVDRQRVAARRPRRRAASGAPSRGAGARGRRRREVVAVAGEGDAALVGDHLQAVSAAARGRADLRAQQAADVGAVRVGPAGVQLAADRGAADPGVLLEDADGKPGAGEVAGGGQAVVAGADDDGVVVRFCWQGKAPAVRPSRHARRSG